MLDEIIAAFATPVGTSGLQVLRVAGKGSADLADRIFSFGPLPKVGEEKKKRKTSRTVKKLKGYQAAFGYIHELDKPDEPIDQVVLTRFSEGKSYTGEEQVEISIHGGMALRRATLDLVLDAGARLAEPGEFSKWAFINGKMDLSQAEAVMDIIEADTSRQQKAALRHLQGDTANKLTEIKNKVYELLSSIEVDIEYPEYEDFNLQKTLIDNGLEEVIKNLESIIQSNRQGRVLREGLQLVLVGEPNVGKSSILNAISGEDRAIVTDIAGTTRDSIELKVDIEGIPVTICDTAGIRDTDDPIEKMGVDRAKDLLSKADLLFLILTPQDLETLQAEIEEFMDLSAGDKDLFIVFNKMDIAEDYYEQINSWEYLDELKKQNQHFQDFIWISALKGEAISDLKELLVSYYESMSGSGASDLILTSTRQQNLIENAYEIFKQLDQDKDMLPNDILAAGLRQGLELLGEITGEDVSENILNDIFSRFCIGK